MSEKMTSEAACICYLCLILLAKNHSSFDFRTDSSKKCFCSKRLESIFKVYYFLLTNSFVGSLAPCWSQIDAWRNCHRVLDSSSFASRFNLKSRFGDSWCWIWAPVVSYLQFGCLFYFYSCSVFIHFLPLLNLLLDFLNFYSLDWMVAI